MLGVNLRGEMRVMQDQSNSHPKVLDLPLLEKMKQCMNVSSHQVNTGNSSLVGDSSYINIVHTSTKSESDLRVNFIGENIYGSNFYLYFCARRKYKIIYCTVNAVW